MSFYMFRNEMVLVNFDPLRNASSNTATVIATNINNNKSPIALLFCICCEDKFSLPIIPSIQMNPV